MTGFSTGSMPFMYLGVPLFKGKPKKLYLQPIVDRVKLKLASWKGVLLSIMGRVQLVQSVVQSMLLYSFQVYSWPVSLLNLVDKWCRNFIWSGHIDSKKLVTVPWSVMCSSIEEGGLNLRSIKSLNKASMMKLCWNLVSSDDQWAVLTRARVMQNNKPNYHISSSIWLGMKPFMNTVMLNTRWLLGDDTSINFWRDRWLTRPILDFLQIP